MFVNPPSMNFLIYKLTYAKDTASLSQSQFLNIAFKLYYYLILAAN